MRTGTNIGASDRIDDGLLLCEGADVARCIKEVIGEVESEGRLAIGRSFCDDLISPR